MTVEPANFHDLIAARVREIGKPCLVLSSLRAPEGVDALDALAGSISWFASMPDERRYAILAALLLVRRGGSRQKREHVDAILTNPEKAPYGLALGLLGRDGRDGRLFSSFFTGLPSIRFCQS